MDKEAINRFRNEVNEQGFVLQMYHNHEGKNLWNIICSAMDWIDVVVEMIDAKNLSGKNDNDSSIKVMTLIMCIDVMWEAVRQLHRVFFATDTIPFTNSTEIFRHKLFKASDNDYFKTIRACFAAHPINLNDYFTRDKQKERRYASWSGGGFSNGDFSVILYSNQSDKDAIFLDIYFDELLKFAEQRYTYLNTISEEIVRQRGEYLSFRKNTRIERTGSVDDQILVLIKEARRRFNSDYYDYELNQLKIIFFTQITSSQNLKIVSQYREALLCKVDELFRALQEMKLITLESTQKINDHCPPQCRYTFSKLVDAVYSYGPIQLVNMSEFEACLGHIIDFRNITSTEELYVCIKAGFYYLNTKEQL